jgi:hypothetical protein
VLPRAEPVSKYEQLPRILHWELPQQDDIEQREDGRVSPDAERQRKEGDDREARASQPVGEGRSGDP